MGRPRFADAVLSAAVVTTLAGCQTELSQREKNALELHVVAMEEEGTPVDFATGRELKADEFDRRIDAIFDDAVRSATANATKADPASCRNPRHHHPAGKPIEVRRLLVHIHGGMNDPKFSAKNAANMLADIEKEATPADRCAPIFLTWPSGFLSSYGEHLFELRNGTEYKTFGIVTSPIWFVEDLARGVINAPIDDLYMLMTDLQVGTRVTTDRNLLSNWNHADEVYAEIERDKKEAGNPAFVPTGYHATLGEYHRGFWTQAWRGLVYTVLLPVKLVTTPIALDGMGKSAWEAMVHRANNALRPTEEFERDSRHAWQVRERMVMPATGAFAHFMRRLDDWMKDRKCGADDPGVCWEVTLVGHSMGTIIANDVIELYPDLPIRNLIYMGAACSVKQAQAAVVPFLTQNPQAEFFNLTLHPVAEADEIEGYDLPARGSLLEWVDNWYTSPTHPLDRRLGKWVNAMESIHVFRDVRSRVFVKGFGVVGGEIPQKHGDFDDCPFWKAEFRSVDGSTRFPRRN